MQPWVTEIDRYMDNPNVQLLLVGNKTDLTEKRVVSKGQAEVMCELGKKINVLTHTHVVCHIESDDYCREYSWYCIIYMDAHMHTHDLSRRLQKEYKSNTWKQVPSQEIMSSQCLKLYLRVF